MFCCSLFTFSDWHVNNRTVTSVHLYRRRCWLIDPLICLFICLSQWRNLDECHYNSYVCAFILMVICFCFFCFLTSVTNSDSSGGSSSTGSLCFTQQSGPVHLSPKQPGSACLIRTRLVWKEQLVLEKIKKKKPEGIIDPSQLSPQLLHIRTQGCDLWNYWYATEICFWGALSAPQCAVKAAEETQWRALGGRRLLHASTWAEWLWIQLSILYQIIRYILFDCLRLLFIGHHLSVTPKADNEKV